MEVLILLIFLGLVLVLTAFAAFAWTVQKGSLDHSDRLALLPLDSDLPRRARAGTEIDSDKRDPSPLAPERDADAVE